MERPFTILISQFVSTDAGEPPKRELALQEAFIRDLKDRLAKQSLEILEGLGGRTLRRHKRTGACALKTQAPMRVAASLSCLCGKANPTV